MNEYERMLAISNNTRLLHEKLDYQLSNWSEICEQLFAEYLMEAGMIPERIPIPNEAYAHYLKYWKEEIQ